MVISVYNITILKLFGLKLCKCMILQQMVVRKHFLNLVYKFRIFCRKYRLCRFSRIYPYELKSLFKNSRCACKFHCKS